MKPASAAITSTARALRGVADEYCSPPSSAHGNTSTSPAAPMTTSSWRRLPKSASHTTGSSTSG